MSLRLNCMANLQGRDDTAEGSGAHGCRGQKNSLAPSGITSDLAAVLWRLSRMASSFIRGLGRGGRKQINFAGGRPAASHFLLLRQNKVTKEKATPVCRPCGVPSISRKQAGLRNSTWRGAHPAPHSGTRTVLA